LASENRPKYSFFFQKDDRVLGLEFTQNSRYLFSGHGSGLVLQWDLRKLDAAKFEPVGQLPLNFTASSLAFLGKDDRNLVIAGRYNRMVIWNGTSNQLRLISYPQEGSQNDYIESLDTVISNQSFLVTGDNQGYITLWNVGDCLTENNQQCGQVLDRWNTGHQEKPVRSVALSDDGCYLVSGGDDGRVMLWPLTQLGRRATEFLDGKPVEGLSLSQGINDVDLKVVKNRLLIASGNKDHRVRVKWEKRHPQVGCDR
jgi:WD40 repeat protein